MASDKKTEELLERLARIDAKAARAQSRAAEAATPFLERLRKRLSTLAENFSHPDGKKIDVSDEMAGSLRDVSWLARTLRDLGRTAYSAREKFNNSAFGTFADLGWRATKASYGVVRPVVNVTARYLRWNAYDKDSEGFFHFNKKKAAKRLAVHAFTLVAGYGAYWGLSRHEGQFLINDKHLAESTDDIYQIGGCYKTSPDQKKCGEHDGMIVIMAPTAIPGLGIFSWDYDTDAGRVPSMGECHLVTHGIYLRVPGLPFVRGAIKPFATTIGSCQAITTDIDAIRERLPEAPATTTKPTEAAASPVRPSLPAPAR